MTAANKPIHEVKQTFYSGRARMLFGSPFRPDKFKPTCYTVTVLIDPDASGFAKFKADYLAFRKAARERGLSADHKDCLMSAETYIARREDPEAFRRKYGELLEGMYVLEGKTNVNSPFNIAVEALIPGTKSRQTKVINEDTQSEIYPGMYCVVGGTFKAYQGQNPSITFWWGSVLKLNDGERLGGLDLATAVGDLIDEEDDAVGADLDGAMDSAEEGEL